MIYLDNAATTFPKPPEVEHAVMAAFHTIGNAGRGAHAATLDASRIIYGTRERLAELFHAEDASRIAFTANVTESLNIAIQGLFEPGDHVITSVCEHNSVLRPLYLMEQRGVKVTYLPADSKGRIAYDELENAYEPETKAVVIMHASNLTGNVTDLEQIAAFTQKHHLLFVVDAAQTAGVLPIDVQKQNIDVLCFTGHKGLFGPQGTGGIYVRKGVEIRPLFAGGTGVQSYSRTQPKEMPTLLEAGTLNGHGIAGLYAALGYLQKTGIDKIYGREMALAERFYNGVKDISGVKIYGDFTWSDTENDPMIPTFYITDTGFGFTSGQYVLQPYAGGIIDFTFTAADFGDTCTADIFTDKGALERTIEEEQIVAIENEITNQITAQEYETFTQTADAVDASGFDDFNQTMNQDFTGTWYDPEMKEAFRLTSQGAYVYIPYLDLYGDELYEWELIDRSAKGLCPELAIYINGRDSGPLAYYVAGYRDGYFWCNAQSQIFYKQ